MLNFIVRTRCIRGTHLRRHRHATNLRGFLTLAIETSCDDTSVAVLELEAADRTRPSSASATIHCSLRKTADMSHYRGIHPFQAAKHHQLQLPGLVQDALEALPDASPSLRLDPARTVAVRSSLTGKTTLKAKPDLIAVTRGPGMAASLNAGMSVAQGLSAAFQIPIVGVHHMLAHAWTPGLCHALKRDDNRNQSPSPFPSYSLLVSGGHTLLTYSSAPEKHTILTDTADTAIGDALDKAGRLLLPEETISTCGHTSYGALLEDFAFGDQTAEEPSEYEAVYQPGQAFTPPARKAFGDWGWSFQLPFAGRTREHIFGKIQRERTRADRNFGKMAQTAESTALPFTFSGAITLLERFLDPTQRLVWDPSNNRYNRLTREPGGQISIEERRDLAKAVLTLTFEYLARVVVDSVALHRRSLEPGPDAASPSSAVPLILAGGVSANVYLRHVLQSYISSRVVAPSEFESQPAEDRIRPARSVIPIRMQVHPTPLQDPVARQLCTDNAAMIAWAGTWMHWLGISMSKEREKQLILEDFDQHDHHGYRGGVVSRWSLEDLELKS